MDPKAALRRRLARLDSASVQAPKPATSQTARPEAHSARSSHSKPSQGAKRGRADAAPRGPPSKRQRTEPAASGAAPNRFTKRQNGDNASKFASKSPGPTSRRGRAPNGRGRQQQHQRGGGAATAQTAAEKSSARRAGREAALQGAQFRVLNELLYTNTSAKAVKHFADHPTDFEAYHNGFRSQANKWPRNPVQLIQAQLKRAQAKVSGSKPGRKLVVGDFGCGDARLARKLGGKLTVHSFDLVALNPLVTVCDIAHVPLEDASLDCAVFSLSLMGTNFVSFLAEAVRTVRVNGVVIVAEVASRFDTLDDFLFLCKKLGLDMQGKDESNSHFVLLTLKKSDRAIQGKLPALTKQYAKSLKPCLYKKR